MPGEIFASETIEDPYPLFARLRREHPISRIAETGVHLVATWDLVDEALRRDADFSANLTGVLIRGKTGEPAAFPLPTTGANQVIATADDPDHAVHRALVAPRLAPRLVAPLAPRVRTWTRAALEPLLASAGGDFAPIAEIIPARALAHVLGLPDADAGRHRQWAMMGGDMLAGDVGEADLLALASETGRMVAYLGEHLARARTCAPEGPGPPILHALAGGVEREQVGLAQAIGIAMVMFGAAGESTAALIGSAVRALAERPALAAELRREPAAIPRFVEEIVRLEPPFKFHYRVVRRACALGGAELVEGDRLMLLWASANRDAAHFDDPDALRLDRRHPKRHMSFGRGVHFCVGAPLARLEASVVVEELLARTSEVALRGDDPPEYARSIFVRRLDRLPLDVRASA